jgi:hypothetical protein
LLQGDLLGLFEKSGIIGRLAATGLFLRENNAYAFAPDKIESGHAGFRIKHVDQAGAKIVNGIRFLRIFNHGFLTRI